MARSRVTAARDVERGAARQRPTVTLVTSDLKGSTALGERLDPEALREVLNRYFAVMRAVFESHGGRIEKIIGDAIVAVFGLPEPAEDDALRAVDAAAESMRALATLNDELEAGWGVRLVTRTGVASGEVTFGEDLEGQHVLLGRTVDVSGVMEQNAPPLEVLIADSTRALVADSVEVEAVEPVSPKGSDERLEAFRLVSVRAREGHLEQGPATAQAVAARDTRRTVTLVFALAKAHSMTGEEPGAGVLRDVMSRYFDAMRGALEHHGGTVEKYIGDAVMAVFGLPFRHEDDAIRAVRAASDMQAALGSLNEAFRAEFGVELEGHIGVNTGEVIATGDSSSAQRLVTGDTVNTAARLEQAAGAGEIVLGELTRRLAGIEAEVEAIPPLTLKGKAEPVPAYRLVGLGHRSSTTSATPFVGRAAELGRLNEALGDAVAGRRARLVTVVGDAGVGKSRLIREFADGAGATATVLRGRCLPYGNGITFWPLNEAAAGVAMIEAGDSPPVAIEKLRTLVRQTNPSLATEDATAIVDRVAAAINLTTVQFPIAELLWGARRLLEALAYERPLVFIIDDLHSAESTFLDLVDAVVGTESGVPIVLLCSARRELLERHADWSQAHARDTITLTPLSEDEAGAVVGELLGALDPSVRERIAAAAEGNPLYLEQIVSMLVETRAIERDGDRWVARAGTDQLAIPPTVQALVAARLDALGSEERQVIEPASVIGLSFAEDALGELVDEPLKPVLDEELGSLAGKELIRPVQGPEVVFRFGHGVIRDTAYGGLLKRVRAALHERFVAWAERVNKERGRETEFEEILGFHLEQAYRYRTELGVIDDHARDIGERAADKLGSAGRRALARTDMPAAASLLGRAVALIPHQDGPRVELLLDLAEADGELGDFTAAGVAVGTALEIVAGMDDARLAARCRLSRLVIRNYAPEAIAAEAVPDETVVKEAIQVLESVGDDAGLARAWRVQALLSAKAGRYGDSATAAERLIEHAHRANELRLVARGASGYANQAVWSSQPVAGLIERLERSLSEVEGDRKAEANISLSLAQLHAMRGGFERARELYRRGQSLLRDLGPSISATTTSIAAARVETLAGALAAAEAELRRDEADLALMNERYYRSSIAAALARVLLQQAKVDEADRFARLAEEIADPEDTDPQVVSRAVRAQLAARSGRRDEARELIASAVHLSAETDDVTLRADVLKDESEVLLLLGRRAEAEASLRAALALYEEKGDVVSARAIRDRTARGGLTPPVEPT